MEYGYVVISLSNNIIYIISDPNILLANYGRGIRQISFILKDPDCSNLEIF